MLFSSGMFPEVCSDLTRLNLPLINKGILIFAAPAALALWLLLTRYGRFLAIN